MSTKAETGRSLARAIGGIVGVDVGKAMAHEADTVPRMYGDNVLVLMDWLRDKTRDVTTAGGILLLRSADPEPTEAVWATVVAAGPGMHLDKCFDCGCAASGVGSKVFQPVEVAPGDRVLVDKAMQGEALMVDGLEHRIIRAHNVLLVADEGDGVAA